jgi:hypothetical protein
VLDARAGHEQWTELALEGQPAMRSSGMGFYDALRDRTFVGFGNDATIYRDLNGIGY